MPLPRRSDLGFTCQGCPDRYPGCHGKCEKYKQEKAAWSELNKKANRGKDVDYYIMHKVMKGRDTSEKKRRGTQGYHKFGN